MQSEKSDAVWKKSTWFGLEILEKSSKRTKSTDSDGENIKNL
jgi:hypothetical protein